MNRYTADFYDDDDRRPYWGVIEWIEQHGAFRTGRLIEKHDTQHDAQSAANAYNLIHAFAN